jgi:hypothetical protein
MSFWKNMTEKNGFYSIDEALNLGMISQNTTYNNSNKVENFSYNGSSYFGQVSNTRQPRANGFGRLVTKDFIYEGLFKDG